MKPASTSAGHHASPLRYPGGKAKLARLFKLILRENRLLDCVYAEPFAGGAGAGLALLTNGYVRQVHINDASESIYNFWQSALNSPDCFCQRILDVPLTVDEWQKQRAIFSSPEDHEPFDHGFAAFFLNRTNHSGVLNGGMIGGKLQKSKYGLDARFNRSELVARIRRLERYRNRIHVTKLDALDFLSEFGSEHRSRGFVYADPPYYVKGRDLYYDYYSEDDHSTFGQGIGTHLSQTPWVVSYDDVPEISSIYRAYRSVTYSLSYSVRGAGRGQERMFFSDGLRVPPSFEAANARLNIVLAA